MERIIFSVVLLFKFIMLGHADLCFFNHCVGKREETNFEIFFRYLNECVLFIGSYQKDLYVLKTMIVLSLIGTITIIVLLNRVIKGRHRTQRNDWSEKDFANTNQGSMAAEVNIRNTCASNPAHRNMYELTIVQRWNAQTSSTKELISKHGWSN